MFKSLLCFTLALVIETVVNAEPPKGELKIKQDNIRIGLHEPVIAEMIAHNPWPMPIVVDFGANLSANFSLAVDQPDGRHTEIPRRELESGSVGIRTIGSGESVVLPILINEWLSPDALGTYRIQFEIDGLQNRPVLDLIVGPREPNRLRAICDKLAKEATSAPASLSIWPAHVLSLIIDPLAVPYLSILSTRRDNESFAIEGLERIGSLEAAESLAALIDRSHDDLMKIMARGALRRIRARARDGRMRNEIDRILSRSQSLDRRVNEPPGR